MTAPADIAAYVLAKLKSKRPLVLCLTNSVVQNFTANLLLAVGGVPVMLNHKDEVKDILRSCTNALLINVGTLSTDQAELMQCAVSCASEAGIPWVLDPVAVGLLSYRTQFCAELLHTPPAMIRGNASEIMALAGVDAAACRGPESGAASSDALDAARVLSARTASTVLVTGETDYITHGDHTYSCTNGHELMTRITGMGCAMGALAAACSAVANTALHAAIATAAIMGVCGDRAILRAQHPGSFAAAMLDELDILTPETLKQQARLTTHARLT